MVTKEAEEMLDFHKQLKQELDHKHKLTEPGKKDNSEPIVDRYVAELFTVV